MNADPATGPAMAPTGMQLVGAVVRAFDATKDAPERARCVLRSRTARRGFRGECETRRWCCPLSALCHFLVERKLIHAPSTGGVEAQEWVTVFFPLAIENICWELVRQATPSLSLRAHFRYAVTVAAHRVGLLLATAERPSFLVEPTWADPKRRVEPLQQILSGTGFTQKQLADDVGFGEDTVSRWMAGDRPSNYAMDLLGGVVARRLATMDATVATRNLRWHYALADLADAASAVLGRDVVSEAARVFTKVVGCVQGGVASRASEAVGVGMRSVHALNLCSHFTSHIEAHGASAEFVRDVQQAASEWAAAMPSVDDADHREIEMLVRYMPRRNPRRPHWTKR